MPMPVPIEVFADLTLLINGQTTTVTAEGNRILVTFPSLRYGLRAVRSLLKQRYWIDRLEGMNSTLTRTGLSLYFKAGSVSAPVLGAESHRQVLPALMDLLRRYGALVGRQNR